MHKLWAIKSLVKYVSLIRWIITYFIKCLLKIVSGLEQWYITFISIVLPSPSQGLKYHHIHQWVCLVQTCDAQSDADYLEKSSWENKHGHEQTDNGIMIQKTEHCKTQICKILYPALHITHTFTGTCNYNKI